MTSPVDPDAISRTALLGMLTGAASTLEQALEQEANSGCVIVADLPACQCRSGQAALLTVLVAAVRAFGQVKVELSFRPELHVLGGIHKGRSLAEVIEAEGGLLPAADAWAFLALEDRDNAVAVCQQSAALSLKVIAGPGLGRRVHFAIPLR